MNAKQDKIVFFIIMIFIAACYLVSSYVMSFVK